MYDVLRLAVDPRQPGEREVAIYHLQCWVDEVSEDEGELRYWTIMDALRALISSPGSEVYDYNDFALRNPGEAIQEMQVPEAVQDMKRALDRADEAAIAIPLRQESLVLRKLSP